jgi:membrane protease YdiL (CAAX protease family)
MDPSPSSPRRLGTAALARPLLVALGITGATTAASRGLPDDWQALGVAAVFLGGAWWWVVRGDDSHQIRRHGLSLGGLVEAEPLDAGRLFGATASALGWAALTALLLFPPFWLGFVAWWRPPGAFSPALPAEGFSLLLGQLLVIALPEEAFYRGYLQTALDDALPPSREWLGARVGWAVPITSLIFALGHFATEAHPSRLAVFFPSLVFGWLRARTGGVGAGLAFHAACNLFAAFLAQGYGLTG